MIPVDQTNLTPERGDCFSACLASLLGMACGDFPNLNEIIDPEGNWITAYQEWLYDNLGVRMIAVPFFQRCKYWIPEGTLFVGGGLGPRTHPHAVVMQRLQGKDFIVHDPHPSRDGLVGNPIHLFFLTADIEP